MIKELWKWIWELIRDIFTFEWNHIIYDIQNIWWYLIYGFTFSDIQDMDSYLTKKTNKMLDKFIKYHFGFPHWDKDSMQYDKDLDEMKHLSSILFTAEFEDLKPQIQEKLQNRYVNLLKKYYYTLWF